jgi:hypothetical protein
MNLVRDCLDKQLVDRHGHKMGRVDGIILEVGDDRLPTVSAIEVGPVCQAARFHPIFARMVKWITNRFGVVRKDPYRLPWSKVIPAGIEVIAGVEAEDTPALGWELWLRKHIIERIPGG